MSQYKRCFTFGCSLSSYIWPMWPDLLAHQLDIPVYSYGKPGLGNVGIHCLLLDADIEHSFTDQDLIFIMWSHWSREDRYIRGVWESHGNIFNNPFYDKDFLIKYWDWDNDVIKNATAIIMANRAFKITDQWSILNYGDKEFASEKRGDMVTFNKYLPYLPKLPNLNGIHNSQFANSTTDPHPDIIANVEFYNKFLAEKYNFPIINGNSVFHQAQEKLIQELRAGTTLTREHCKELGLPFNPNAKSERAS